MVIFNELSGRNNEKKNYEGSHVTTVPIFDRIEAIIKHNIEEYGDTTWMVLYYISKLQCINCFTYIIHIDICNIDRRN